MKDFESSILLPKGYQPTEYDVICGRGKGHYNQPGNKLFRDILAARLQEYKALKTKIDKTMFLNKIIEEVRLQNNGKAHFVRMVDKDRWEIIGTEKARDKVGHAIREALAPRYKALARASVKYLADGSQRKTGPVSNDTEKQEYVQRQGRKNNIFELSNDLFEPLLPVSALSMSVSMSYELVRLVREISGNIEQCRTEVEEEKNFNSLDEKSMFETFTDPSEPMALTSLSLAFSPGVSHNVELSAPTWISQDGYQEDGLDKREMYKRQELQKGRLDDDLFETLQETSLNFSISAQLSGLFVSQTDQPLNRSSSDIEW